MNERSIRRHPAWVRVIHWVMALCLILLLMSGLQIFNAHRALYLGRQSDFAHPLFALPGGFPHWIILPGYQDLATGRVWHFFLAWVLVLGGALYAAIGLVTGHISRDLLPTRAQWRGIGRSVRDHLLLRFRAVETERGYNVLQKVAYLIVMFGLLPLMVLTGLAMSPAMDAACPTLPGVFGGRQSARTIHFVIAGLLVLFTIIHLMMVLLSGPIDRMRGMITGRVVPSAIRRESRGGRIVTGVPVPRRRVIARTLAAGGLLSLGGCDALSQSPAFRGGLAAAEWLNLRLQRALMGEALAREYRADQISRQFRANGSTDPPDAGYRRLAASGFADWRLQIDGLVDRPLSLTLDALRAMPSRTQITRHDCVEGWSCIGQWTGVPLAFVLDRARLHPAARFLVFFCADTMEETLEGPVRYYESIDRFDAFHPQTILAYAMNGVPLPVAYGAPLRVRVERQLGYKMAKYVMRIEAVASLGRIGRGQGGFWEDRGYQWYAGI